MSIINEALKKVQDGLQNSKGPSPIVPPQTAAPVTSNTPAAVVKKAAGNNSLVLLLIIVCALAAGAACLYLKPAQDITATVPTPKPVVSAPIAVKPVPQVAPAAITPLPMPTEAATPAATLTPPPAVTTVTTPVATQPVSAAATPATAPVAVAPTQAAAAASTPVAKSDESASLKIEGIVSDKKGNVALINGKVYAEGDDINGAKITSITLTSVVISKDGTEETIHVGR